MWGAAGLEYSPEGRQLSISDNCRERDTHACAQTHAPPTHHGPPPFSTVCVCVCVGGIGGVHHLATVLAESSMGRPGARHAQRGGGGGAKGSSEQQRGGGDNDEQWRGGTRVRGRKMMGHFQRWRRRM